MKRLVFIVLMIIPLVGTTVPARAQSDEMRAANRQYRALYAQGKYAEALPFARRVAELGKKEFGPDHQKYAFLLNNLATLYKLLGRYGEAESLFVRSLAIKESSLGPEDPSIATALNNLASLYESQGRHGEAEPLHKRSLTIREIVFGRDHPAVAFPLNNLALLYQAQGRFGEAEPLLRRAMAIRVKSFGIVDPRSAAAINNLAKLYADQSRDDKAEPLYKSVLAIREKTLDPDHPAIATSLNNLALLHLRQRRYVEAGPLFKRALAIFTNTLGPNHPLVSISLNNLAVLAKAQRRPKLFLDYSRRASAIRRNRAARMVGDRRSGGRSEQRRIRHVFLRHVRATIETPVDDPSMRDAQTGEGFEAGQLANATGAAAAIGRMAARFAAGNDALAVLIRGRQDATAGWRRLERALVNAASRPPEKRDRAREAALRRQQKALDDRINRSDAQLAESFPQFANLSSLKPVPLVETQALLADDEALLTYLVWDKLSFLFVVRRNSVDVRQIQLGAKALKDAVTRLRRALDPENIERLADLPPFDTALAFKLYQKLFAPAEPLLQGTRHVFVVPDGALQSLPLGVLVTKHDSRGITGFSDYRRTPWLARKYAMTTLPSVSSLKALRRFARRSSATRPFLGIGDPKLQGETGSGRSVRLASLLTARGIADVNQVRQLSSLPDSAGELRSLAQTLGAGDDALILGTEATETRIKRTALQGYKVLAFATHGLVAGELRGLSEPALVLTPPARGTGRDDGLLTASEVASLTLDADWVILSACNTAAADGAPGAEGLSGLAKAFFYAGSRSLLVSHWPVVSDAAVRITTRTMVEAKKTGVGQAEAHRRAMMALIDDTERPHYAHPLFWAPFVVVGEGGQARQ